jgi:hypothetical protein
MVSGGEGFKDKNRNLNTLAPMFFNNQKEKAKTIL